MLTEGRTDMTRLIVAFPNFAKAPTNEAPDIFDSYEVGDETTAELRDWRRWLRRWWW